MNNPAVINIWVAPHGSGRAVISDYHLQLLTVFLNVTRSICFLISCVLCGPHHTECTKKRSKSKSLSSFSTLTAMWKSLTAWEWRTDKHLRKKNVSNLNRTFSKVHIFTLSFRCNISPPTLFIFYSLHLFWLC